MSAMAAIKQWGIRADSPEAFDNALKTVSQAFAVDAPADFLMDTVGGGARFLPTLIGSLLGELPQMELHTLPGFECVAFLHEEALHGDAPATAAAAPAAPGGSNCGSGDGDGPWSQTVRAAHAAGSAAALEAAGVPPGDAALMLLVPPHRLDSLSVIMRQLPGLCQRYIVERAGGQPVWHFDFMGVLPQSHGQGLGSQMLRHLTTLADARGVHMYLEASTPDSRRLYLRWGFQDFDTLTLRPGVEGGAGDEAPIRFYGMGRPPQPPAPAE